MKKFRPHGLRCYWRGCRHEICKRAHAKYCRQWRGSPLESVMTVKAIVDNSIPYALARKAKLSHVTVWNIKIGKTKRIRRLTKERILQAER